ncbi:hypothetical protein ACET3Z_000888 [Daucus carota]
MLRRYNLIWFLLRQYWINFTVGLLIIAMILIDSYTSGINLSFVKEGEIIFPAHFHSAVMNFEDPAGFVQLHEKVKPITWAISLVREGHDKTPLGLASRFCVSSEGFIMTSARSFEGLKQKFEIRARRLDTDKNVKAQIFHVKKEWDMVMLKVEGCACESGVFVADNAFYCGQPLLCIGRLLHSVGSFRLGQVAFNTEKFVRVPKEEDNELRCGTYGIHVAALKIFKDDAFKKIGPKSADKEGDSTTEGSALKKARTD